MLLFLLPSSASYPLPFPLLPSLPFYNPLTFPYPLTSSQLPSRLTSRYSFSSFSFLPSLAPALLALFSSSSLLPSFSHPSTTFPLATYHLYGTLPSPPPVTPSAPLFLYSPSNLLLTRLPPSPSYSHQVFKK